MKESIKIGVMGCANIAERSLIPAIKNHPDFELKAVASRTPEKAQSFSDKFNCKGIVGYENLLFEEIDAVYIPLPTGLHEEWVTKCLSAGKHVFVEKSFGMDYDSTCKMLQIAKENKLVAMENFMFPYHSQTQFLRNLWSTGEIGEIRNFKASFGFPPLDATNFRYNAEIGGGALLDAAAYTVKAAQVLLGNELEFLSSTMQFENNVDIYGSAHFIYNNRVPVQLAWGFDNFYSCGVDIWGSKGRITTNRSFTANIGFQPSIKVETQQEVKDYLLPADDHFENILSQLAINIQNKNYLEKANEIAQQSKLLTDILIYAKKS